MEDVHYEIGNSQLMKREPKGPKNIPSERREFNREKELADIVYIFTTPDKPGIRFYDRTQSGAEAQMTGVLSEGKFITDMDSITKAEWDEALNKANTASKVITRKGEVVVRTIIVSEEQLNRILSEIIRQKGEKRKRVVIDTVDRRLENRGDHKKTFSPDSKNLIPDAKYDNKELKEF